MYKPPLRENGFGTPRPTLWQPSEPAWTADRPEEPSVSIERLGPFKPKQKLKRLEVILVAAPVADTADATAPQDDWVVPM
mmetsp:Transcript_54002/g.122139  ORF Transcript_54002/g.122139 Transcript_54002/m.122139 type:complete len:80 (-) Transcript_54002:1319-1558(-)